MAFKLFRRSKVGQKTRVVNGERYDVVLEDLPQNTAKKRAAELRDETDFRHFIYNGDGGTMVLRGGRPKRPSRSTKSTTPKRKPTTAATPRTKGKAPSSRKKARLNPTLRAWNELRSMQAAFCDGDTNESAVDAAENAYVKLATKGKKQTAASARRKADSLRKCKN